MDDDHRTWESGPTEHSVIRSFASDPSATAAARRVEVSDPWGLARKDGRTHMGTEQLAEGEGP